MGRWRVGIDIGGTFTDVAAVQADSGAMRSAKVRSRRGDELASLQAALAAIRLEWDDVCDLVHGTTLVTNAIVEERLPQVALVATEGFADTLAIGRQNRLHLYRLDAPPKVPCLVPDARRFEVRERIAANGEVLTSLDRVSASSVVKAVAETGVQSAAVSLIHAYANPAHELELERMLRERVRHVSLSHRVNPEEREFERTNATVLTAAVMPLVAEYLERLRASIPSRAGLHLFHSAGGMVSAAMACEQPLVLALSGPAAGVAAACETASRLELGSAIAFDMGGTTTDVCLIRDGAAELRFDRALAGRQFRQLVLSVESIGAGGGSIARLERGILKVGPRSAGADPGPACYARGGIEPTVTDANVVLGYLDTRWPLADGVELDRRRAEQALLPLAAAMGSSLIETALGIVRVANANMVRAIRNITVERGVDERRCTLIAYGGAGPMHAAALARECGIAKVVVPAASGVFSALGCATAAPRYTRQQTLRMASGCWDAGRFTVARDALVDQVRADLRLDDVSAARARVQDVALVRYAGQSYSVKVPYAPPPDAQRIGRDFCGEHRRLYGFATEESWEIEAIRVCVFLPQPRPSAALHEEYRGKRAAEETVQCWFGPERATATLRRSRAALEPFQPLAGPTVIADEWSTIVVPPDSSVVADGEGNLTLSLRETR